jgi:putative transcriptional regulator
MIRFHLRRCIDDYEFRTRQTLTLVQLSDATGIHRATLSKLLHERGCNVTTDVVDRLCKYFGVGINELMELLPDENS